MTDFIVVIPARYASSRLPGKPLLTLANKPMLQHTYNVALKAGAQKIIIATDDERIKIAAKNFDADVCMTSGTHQSGTDRLAEVMRLKSIDDEAIIVNLQGDEPLMPPELISQVANNLELNSAARISTLAIALESREEFMDPNCVKVVRDKNNFAQYFSRAAIPWDRTAMQDVDSNGLSDIIIPLRHLGIYAYRASFLREFTELKPVALEQAEQLEQLRALWYGEKIHVDIAICKPGPGVDTPQDLARAEACFLSKVNK